MAEINKQIISRYQVLNVGVDAVTMDSAIKHVISWQEDDKSRFIVTANAEMVMRAQTDKRLANIISKADLVLPDGAGIVWAGEQLGLPFKERVAGVDFVVELLTAMAEIREKVYFLGGAPGVAERAVNKLKQRVSELCFAGVRDGYFTDADETRIISDIKESGAKLLLVGLGVPKQEKWIYQNYESLPGITAIGVGGSFDVLSGMLPRAPLWMQRRRLEWLYRLYRQPSRIGRMVVLPRFMWKVQCLKRVKKD